VQDATVAGAAVLGLLVGSFLNVVVWRLPRGESLVRPSSHCTSCDDPVSPRDNVPVLSWLLLRGRCRRCNARISPRYPLVELATAVLFAGMAMRFGPHAALPAFLYLAAVGLALALIDLDVHRLPNALTLPSYVVGIVLLGLAALAEHAPSTFLRALAGMAVMYCAYFLLVLAKPGGMGWGDVKLSGVLGLYLGFLGWGAVAVGAFAAFLIGGGVGLALIASKRAGRKTKIPFGPYMVAGALIAVFAGSPLVHWYVHLTIG
jgi:leader peptidase (prepilin peptidase)/N-methyltransferase